MRISNLRIRNFRSIDDLKLDLGPITVLCGPNSCGKSNVMHAIRFAFRENVDRATVYENMIATERDIHGGPGLSIWVDIWFSNYPRRIRRIAGVTGNDPIKYQFRAYRGGKVRRTLNGSSLGEAEFRTLCEAFNAVYVPTIRDPSAGGMEPFQQLFADVLKRSRGTATLASAANSASATLRAKAEPLLREHRDLANKMINAVGFEASPGEIDLDHLYRQVKVSLEMEDGQKVPLESLGTGHQSLFIIHLYRQLGASTSGQSLYLFEEPDNHLHPATIRAVAADLLDMSSNAQVIVSTHSPMLVNLLGLANARSLFRNASNGTAVRAADFGKFTEGQLRHLLMHFGLRLTEPLFARRIILVEGPSDLHIVSRLIELRYQRSPDQLEILVVSAGGKSNVAQLAEVLDAMGADWRAIVDWDAAFNAEQAFLRGAIDEDLQDDLVDSISLLESNLNTETKRGKNATKLLQAIKRQVAAGPPSPIPYDDSVLELISRIVRKLSAAEISALRRALNTVRRREYRELTGQINTWIWGGTIEDIMLSNDERLDQFEDLLVRKGKIRAPLVAVDRDKRLKHKLHNAGHDLELLTAVVDEFEELRLFSRTEINMALDFVMGGLE